MHINAVLVITCTWRRSYCISVYLHLGCLLVHPNRLFDLRNGHHTKSWLTYSISILLLYLHLPTFELLLSFIYENLLGCLGVKSRLLLSGGGTVGDVVNGAVVSETRVMTVRLRVDVEVVLAKLLSPLAETALSHLVFTTFRPRENPPNLALWLPVVRAWV